jgi:plastocyanin
MSATRLVSAGWVLAASPSKVPFYVAGGLLAGWAVVLAIVGITHHEFPGSTGRARLVMFTSAALVAATISTALATSGDEEMEPEATAGTLALTADPGGDPAYDRTRATVPAGRVELRLTSRAPVPHNITIARGSEVLAATDTITGADTAATATLRPGEYVFFCSVGDHRDQGMEGTLTVSRAEPPGRGG